LPIARGPDTDAAAPPRGRGWLAAGVLLAGLLGIATIWVVLTLKTDRACGWMALVAAVDYAMLLRLVRYPPGLVRMALAVVATVLTVVACAWLVVAAQLGTVLGLDPLSSALRLGPVLAWEYTRLGFTAWDWASAAFSPMLAAATAWGGGNPRINGRRRRP